jgi:hypothetical protein
MSAGKVTLDLFGDGQDDLNATIRGGVSSLTLSLPHYVGVLIEVDTGVSDVDSSGLAKDGDNYTNDIYGEADFTLRIDIDGGTGKIYLDVK